MKDTAVALTARLGDLALKQDHLSKRSQTRGSHVQLIENSPSNFATHCRAPRSRLVVCIAKREPFGSSSWSTNISRRGPKPPRQAWWDRWFPPEPPEPPEDWLPGGSAGESRRGEGRDDQFGGPFPGGEVRFDQETFRAGTRGGRQGQPEQLTWQQRLDLIGGPDDDVDGMLEDPERFERWVAWRQGKEEVQDYTGGVRDPDNMAWRDWLDDPEQYDFRKTGGWYEPQGEWEKEGLPREPPPLPERGLSRTFKELMLRFFAPEEEVEEELTFEERVFRFTSQATTKFVVLLVLVPWVFSWGLHDAALVPFMGRYVEKVPLAARVLDLRERQKLELIERLKLERQRVRFEAEIGKAPSLSEEELAEYLQEEARHFRAEVRHENQAAFAYIFSDAFGALVFAIILYLNPRNVEIMKLTGSRIFTNISDTGKAFVIILCSDIFLGYHSESGWETVVEMFLDHYGIESSQNSIYIFVSIVPVTIDACFKLWVFRYLNRLSPSAAATFREMKRH